MARVEAEVVTLPSNTPYETDSEEERRRGSKHRTEQHEKGVTVLPLLRLRAINTEIETVCPGRRHFRKNQD